MADDEAFHVGHFDLRRVADSQINRVAALERVAATTRDVLFDDGREQRIGQTFRHRVFAVIVTGAQRPGLRQGVGATDFVDRLVIPVLRQRQVNSAHAVVGFKGQAHAFHGIRPEDVAEIEAQHQFLRRIPGNTRTRQGRPVEVADLDLTAHAAALLAGLHAAEGHRGVVGLQVAQAGLGLVDGAQANAFSDHIRGADLDVRAVAFGFTGHLVVIGEIDPHVVRRFQVGQRKGGAGDQLHALRGRHGHLEIHAGPQDVQRTTDRELFVHGVGEWQDETSDGNFRTNRVT